MNLPLVRVWDKPEFGALQTKDGSALFCWAWQGAGGSWCTWTQGWRGTKSYRKKTDYNSTCAPMSVHIYIHMIPSTTKCPRSPLGISPTVLGWGSRAILDLWPSPIVDLWRFWFLECLVVYCNMPPPTSMDHPELGKLSLKRANVPDRKFL